MASKKLCCRCNAIIDSTEKCCDSCKAYYDEKKASYNKRYDFYKRDDKATKFYKSKDWNMTRDTVMIKSTYLDLYEYFVMGNIVVADVVHHIIPIKEDWRRKLDRSNLIPLSNSTHNWIHGQYNVGIAHKNELQELLFGLVKRWNSGERI